MAACLYRSPLSRIHVRHSTTTHFTHKNKYSATCIRPSGTRRSLLIIASSRRATAHFIQFILRTMGHGRFHFKLVSIWSWWHYCDERMCLFYFRPSRAVACPLCCSNEQLKFHHNALSHAQEHTHARHGHGQRTRTSNEHIYTATSLAFSQCQLHLSVMQFSGQMQRRERRTHCVCAIRAGIHFREITALLARAVGSEH